MTKQGKLTTKLIRSRQALEKRKFVTRLKKANPDKEDVDKQAVDDAISKSYVSRIRTLMKGLRKKHTKQYTSNAAQETQHDSYKCIPYDISKINTCPWQEMSTGDLTDELRCFLLYAKLSESEAALRQKMLEAVTASVQQRWGFATATPFGSFPANLSTFLSDVDVSLSFDKINSSNTQSTASPDAPTVSPDAPAVSLDISGAREYLCEDEVTWCIDLTGTPVVPTELPTSNDKTTTDNGLYVANDSDSECTISADESHDMHFNIMNSHDPKRLSWTAVADEAVDSPASAICEIPRHQQLNYLRELRSRLKWLPWISSLELRSRARVPIINLQHQCGFLECDVGVIPDHTAAAVDELASGRIRSEMSDVYYTNYAESFVTLTSFLKVFLWNFGLDKPFTGGIGSFKLYVMVAYILLHAPIEAVVNTDIGYLLIVYLKYFGSDKHLSRRCVVRAGSHEVSFEGAHLIDTCRQTFHAAYLALSARLHLLSEQKKHSKVNFFLPLIINTSKVNRYRQLSMKQCDRYATAGPAGDALATLVLSEVQKLHQLPIMPSLADIVRFDPVLGNVLTSLSSTDDALQLVHGRKHESETVERDHTTRSSSRGQKSKPKPNHNQMNHKVDFSQNAKRTKPKNKEQFYADKLAHKRKLEKRTLDKLNRQIEMQQARFDGRKKRNLQHY